MVVSEEAPATLFCRQHYQVQGLTSEVHAKAHQATLSTDATECDLAPDFSSLANRTRYVEALTRFEVSKTEEDLQPRARKVGDGGTIWEELLTECGGRSQDFQQPPLNIVPTE